MTRINLVDPSCLTQKHLQGEFKEITRVFTQARKLVAKKGNFNAKQHNKKTINKEYTVQTSDNPKAGKGHQTFFTNKLSFIENRYRSLADEMESRGYSVNRGLMKQILDTAHKELVDSFWWGDYTPTQQAIALNMKRIEEMK